MNHNECLNKQRQNQGLYSEKDKASTENVVIRSANTAKIAKSKYE